MTVTHCWKNKYKVARAKNSGSCKILYEENFQRDVQISKITKQVNKWGFFMRIRKALSRIDKAFTIQINGQV